MDNNPVLDAIFARRSIRRYKDGPLSDDDLNTLLQTASAAPNAANLQNYSIIVVRDKDKKEALFELSNKQPWVRICPVVMIFLVDTYRHKRWCEVRDADYHHDNFFSILWGMTDAIVAAQNVVITAQGMGLGSVYIGTVLGRMREMIDLFKLPEGTYPAAMLCIGVPNESPDARERIPLDTLVHYDEYQGYTDEAVKTIFASREAAFDGTAKAKSDTANLAQFLTRKRFTRDVLITRAKSAMQALIDQGFWHEEHLLD